MLEQMRRQGASIFVYLIFCLLILIFVINFRPGQSRQGDNGCRGTSNTVIDVDGVEATQTAYKIAYSANRGTGKQKTYIALEVLIRRELLAQAAEARGLIVSDDLMMNEIKQGHFFFGGQTTQIPGIFDQDHVWNLNAFNGWYQQLNVSRNSYIEEQKRGLLAAMMEDVLKESVQVSRDEALSQFLFEHDTAAYDVVAFKPEAYRSALQITDADLDRWAAAHGDEIAARFKADERLYKGTKPSLLLREIFIAKSTGSAGMTDDQAKAKLEQVKKDVGTDKAKFIAAAKDLSTDPAMKASGGSLGWHTADNAMLGDKAVTDAVKAMKPGDVSAVITTDKGAYLILAEDKREGDLKLDQVKREIADILAKDSWSKEAAKRAALTALATVKGNLEDSFKPESSGEPGPNEDQLMQMLQDPSTDPAIKQQIIKLMQSRGGQHGEREVISKDIPAGWTEDDSGAIDAVGTSTGSAIAAGSAGSGGSVVAPLPEPDVVASSDQLPAMTSVDKPGLDRVPATPRQKALPGLGTSKRAAAAVFDDLKPGDIAKQVFDAGGAYVIVQLRDRQHPNVADFDKDADQRVASMREERAGAFVESWLKTKCETLAKDGKIVPAAEKVAERDDAGKPLPVTYKPCMSMR